MEHTTGWKGENSEYGVGFIWRRKVNHFFELFRKETNDDRLDLNKLQMPRDSTNNNVNETKENK